MKIHDQLIEAKFVSRINRFIIEVAMNDKARVYLPNPGRLKELLIPGAPLLLIRRPHEKRKTSYDAVAVWHRNTWVCIDSRIPNQVILEELLAKRLPEFKDYPRIQSEYSHGKSRLDFLLTGQGKCLLEVKGCTLVLRKTALFPDAPTERGTKHLKELTSAIRDGYRTCMLFLIQRPDANQFAPNARTDPDFAEAMKMARAAGVEIIAYTSTFEEKAITLKQRIPVLDYA